MNIQRNKYSEYPYGVTTSREMVGYKICEKYKCNDYPVYNCNMNSKLILYIRVEGNGGEDWCIM